MSGVACKCHSCEYYEGVTGNPGDIYCGLRGGKDVKNGVVGCSSYSPDNTAGCGSCQYNKRGGAFDECEKGLRSKVDYKSGYCDGHAKKNYWSHDEFKSGGNKKGGGCFITTSVCEGLGKSDSCYELELMRTFRDDILRSNPNWSLLVDEYYEIAPEITRGYVEKLSKSGKQTLFYNYISPCIIEIEKGNSDKAVTIYKAMVNELTNKLKESK